MGFPTKEELIQERNDLEEKYQDLFKAINQITVRKKAISALLEYYELTSIDVFTPNETIEVFTPKKY